jgi:WD40 repeat protein
MNHHSTFSLVTPVTRMNVLTGHTECIRSIILSPCGWFLVSASYDRTIRVWDAQQDIITHAKWPASISLCARFIVFGGLGNTIEVHPLPYSIVYDYNTREPFAILFNTKMRMSVSERSTFKALAELLPVELVTLVM